MKKSSWEKMLISFIHLFIFIQLHYDIKDDKEEKKGRQHEISYLKSDYHTFLMIREARQMKNLVKQRESRAALCQMNIETKRMDGKMSLKYLI